MKKFILTVLFLSSTVLTFSQGETNIWYFGNKAGLDFNSGSPVALLDSQMNTREGCATISNSAGQLLFYTDGITVWNKNHDVMPNGNNLLGDTSTTQAAVIVPKPNSSNIYYIIAADDLAGTDGATYSEVDMNLDTGLGDVTINKNILLITPSCEKITVVKKANGTDFWVLLHSFGVNNFLAYSISSLGINLSPIISSVGQYTPTNINETTGYMKFSPNGNKLVNVSSGFGAELFDFDTATGIVSNAQIINNRLANYGIEFSPSGNVVYISSGDIYTYDLIQYDLTATNISNTGIIIHSENYLYSQIAALQLAKNDKIYVNIIFNQYLSVINNPEVLGLGCDFQLNAVFLGGKQTASGLPQFIQSYFNTSILVNDNCFGSSTNFSLSGNQNILSATWNMDDGTILNGTSVSHIYAAPGTYNVSVTATSATGTSTKNRTIKISAVPVIANTLTNKNICGTANSVYDLSQFNASLLGSQSTTDFGVAYFLTTTSLTSNTGAVNVNFPLPLGLTTFYAKVYNLSNPSCYSQTSFTVQQSSKPTANSVSDYIICESLPYNNIEQFDFNTKSSQILGTQDPLVYSISYHNSQNNADTNTGALPLLFTNTLPTEIIYVRIQNNANTSCFSTTTFTLKVIQQPNIIAVPNFFKCDDSSNDGVEMFDLTQKNIEILNGQSDAIFQVKYYYSLLDATNDTSAISSLISNNITNPIIYYSIAAIGNANCKAISSFNLLVSRLPIANIVNPVFLCDDNSNNGKEFFNLQNNNSIILGNQNPTLYSVSYHLTPLSANLNSLPLPANYENISNPQTIYSRVENNQFKDCFAVNSFEIAVNKMPIANQPLDKVTCDDDSNNGFENFDLSTQNISVLGLQNAADFNITYHKSQNDANFNTSVLPNLFLNTVNPQTIFVRIENKLDKNCFDTKNFKLIVRNKPELNMTSIYSICEGSSIKIDAPIGFSSYSWSNGDVTPSTVLTTDGGYYLTVTKNYGDVICNATQNFNVYNSNIAKIDNIEIIDWTDNENEIKVFVTGDGDYEYSIDGINYQNSSQFYNLESGQYTIFVRDKKGCGISKKEVFVLMYPKFFTPNGDGINDFWKIKFSETEKNLSVNIFDRYGKLLKTLDSKNYWDGNFNNELSLSTDYWFVVTRENGTQFKGHFTLKR